MNTRKTFDLPYDIQRLIFRYVSTPTADLIRNLDYESEYVEFNRRRTYPDYYMDNVFGYIVNNNIHQLRNRDQIMWKYRCIDNIERNNRFKGFGLSLEFTKNELIEYCCNNKIKFNCNWSKKKFIKMIYKK